MSFFYVLSVNTLTLVLLSGIGIDSKFIDGTDTHKITMLNTNVICCLEYKFRKVISVQKWTKLWIPLQFFYYKIYETL